MRPRTPPEPRIPPDVRLVELAMAGIGGWFRLRVGEPAACGCNLLAADGLCDVGHALFRLSAAARAGLLDRHRAVT